MNIKTEFLSMSDGIKLAHSVQHAKDAKIGLILIHGLAEHKGRYTEFIDILVNSGISVFAIDLRGHGKSTGKRGDIDYFGTYLSDLDVFVRNIKKSSPELKLALFGHSIGGLIATAYTTNSNFIDFLILSSPSLETATIIKPLYLFPTWLLRKIYIKKRYSESAEMLKYSRNDPDSCHKFTLGLLKNIFIKGVKFTKTCFEKITVPVLILGGRGDNLVNSGKLQSTLDRFKSHDKKIIIYENAKHRIVQNDAKDQSIPDIINWLKEKLD